MRGLIYNSACGQRAVLVPEPASPDGGAAIGRYAIARFDLLTQGRPSHAGWALKEGRSAIAAMARRILQIEAMTTDDCTFSVGVIHAGQWVNCVPSTCRAEVLSVAKTQEDLDQGMAAMLTLQGEENGNEFVVTRGRIVFVAVTLAVGVNMAGRREVLGMAIGASEAEPFRTDFLRDPVRGGLSGVKLVISDAHKGIEAATARVLSTPLAALPRGAVEKAWTSDSFWL